MGFLISRTTKRDLLLGRSASTLSVSTQRRDTVLAPSASMSLKGSQTHMPRHHWTSSRLALFYSFCLKHSSHARRRQRFPLPDNLRAAAVQPRMLPHSRVLHCLGGLRERPSGRTPPTPQDIELIDSSLAHACRARLETYFRATVRAPVPSVDDSSTTIQFSHTS